ncbi:type 4a pilus biogenesis protein PilO [bacterium]|nr:type 4a pilus biogenesis protein PilO [candidate division CSSED10-310 bacterium]
MQWVDTLEAYPAWQRYLVVGIIAVLICVAFYYFKYKPATEEIARYDRQIQELDAKINKGLAMKDKLEEFRKEVFQLKEKMRLAAEVLGNRPNVDLLVKSMENLASQCGLKVEKFQPMPERKKGFYGEIPINLKLFGGYHELGFFYDKIANEARIMNVSDIQIHGQRGKAYSISAACNLTAFWYLGE